MEKSQSMQVLFSKNGLGPTFLHGMLRLAKGATQQNTC
jgi:hypothetical protein